MTAREIEVKEQLEKEGYSYKEITPKTKGKLLVYSYEQNPKEFIFLKKDDTIRKMIEDIFDIYSKLSNKSYFNNIYGLSRDIKKEDIYNNNLIIVSFLGYKKIHKQRAHMFFPFAKYSIPFDVNLSTYTKFDSALKELESINFDKFPYFKENNIKVDFSDIKAIPLKHHVRIENIKIIKDGQENAIAYNNGISSLLRLAKSGEWKPLNRESTIKIEKEQKKNLLKHVKKSKEGKKDAVLQDLNPGVLKLVNNSKDSHFEVRTSGKGGGTYDDNSSSGIDLSIRIPNGKNEEVLLLNLKNYTTFKQSVADEMDSFFKLKEHKNIKKFFILGERSNLNNLKFDIPNNESTFSISGNEYSYKGYGKFWWNKKNSLKLTLDKYFIEQILEPLSETVGIMLSKTKNDFFPSNSFKVVHVNSSVSTEGDWGKCLSDIIKVYNKMKQLGMYTGRVGAILGKIRFSKLGQAKAASVETYFPY